MRRSDANRQPYPNGSLKAFNWGAFFLTWIWAIGNRSLNTATIVLLLLCFVPYVGIGAAATLGLYSGFTGNRRAWENKDWIDAEHFLGSQRRWAKVGAIQFFLVLAILCALPMLFEK